MAKTTTAGIKISDLPIAKNMDDNSIVPFSENNSVTQESFGASINTIRQLLNFENAYTSVSLGLSGTVNGEIFFVYTDGGKGTVNQYINASGTASVVLGRDNNPLVYPTVYGLTDALKTLSTLPNTDYGITQTFSQGQTLSLPVSAYDPARGRRHILIESVGNDSPISEFYLTKSQVAVAGVSTSIYESTAGSHVVTWAAGETSPIVVKSTVGGTYRITLR